MVIICKNINVKDFLTATKQLFFSLRFVDLVVPVEKINNMVIIKVKKVEGFVYCGKCAQLIQLVYRHSTQILRNK